MSRKKVTKKAKAKKATATTAKRTVKKATHSAADALEKNFRDTPAKLITQCRKELSGVKQQEKKLLSELKKTQAQKKTIQKQSVTVAAKHKAKPTATTKKQIATQKQAFEKIGKIIAGLTVELNVLKLAIKGLVQKQNKHTAIQKLLNSFEKEWEIKARQAVAKPRKKTAKKPVASTPAPISMTTTYHEPSTTTKTDLEPVE